MKKSNKGFTLLEVLVSFSMIVLFTAFVLPAFTLLLVERKNNIAQHEANILLQEKMHEYAVSGVVTEERAIINGVEYTMYGDEANVYIEWADLLGRKKKKERVVSKL